jgi:hypothetical protein
MSAPEMQAGSTQQGSGADVWVGYLDGAVRGRYAGNVDGRDYVQLDGDDFARFVDARWVFPDRASADQAVRRAVHALAAATPTPEEP